MNIINWQLAGLVSYAAYGENVHFIVQLSRPIFFTLLFFLNRIFLGFSLRAFNIQRAVRFWRRKKRKYPPVWYQWANTCWWFYYFGTRLICNSAQFTHFFLLKMKWVFSSTFRNSSYLSCPMGCLHYMNQFYLFYFFQWNNLPLWFWFLSCVPLTMSRFTTDI